MKQRQQLSDQGYILIKSLLSPSKIAALLTRLEDLWAIEGDEAGAENYIEPGVRRLANLANKGDIFREVYAHNQVLKIVEYLIGPDIRASMVNARDVPPQTGVRMPFHTDVDGGRNPDGKGYLSATAIWMLDSFTAESGATAFLIGTHKSGQHLRDVLKDTQAPHPDEIYITGQPGDVLIFNGHCWHAGRPNLTDNHRRALLIHYLRADVPRGTNRRQILSPENAASLTPRERELLGLDD